MKRFILLVAVGLFLATAIVLIAVASLRRPSETDYRLARGRALLDADNYLGALQTLRDLPARQKSSSDAHAYLGAAYLRLHLYQAAIKEFEAAAQQKPRTSDPWIGLASTYVELGDVQKAREEAVRATEVEKGSADAWVMLGRALWLQRNFDEAKKAAAKAQELDPQNQAAHELLLRVYFDQGEINEFQSLLDRTPQPSQPIQDLAVQFYIRQGQFARAYDLRTRFAHETRERFILESELALAREPARQDLYPGLVEALVDAGRFSEAIDAGKKYSGSIPIDFSMGKAYWMSGEKDLAIQAYTRASAARVHKLSAEAALAVITSDIRHWREAFRAERVEQDYFVLARLDGAIPASDLPMASFMYRYAGIYDASYYNKAAESAQKVLQGDPVNLDALLTLGTAYQRVSRLDDARRTLELASREYPNNAETWSRLANLMVQEGDSGKILELMERAVKLEPNNAGYLYNLGWLQDQLGNNAQAISLYQGAIRFSSLSFEAMNNLALIYGKAGEPDRALRLLEQAVEVDPSNDAAYLNLATYYSGRRDWKRALASLDEALKIDPANARASTEKGRIFLELGRTAEAIETLNHALEADPHSLDAYLLLSSSYERTGHTDEALAAIDEARRIRPDAPEIKPAAERLKSRKEDQN